MFNKKLKRENEKLRLQVDILTRRLEAIGRARSAASKKGWKTRREKSKTEG